MFVCYWISGPVFQGDNAYGYCMPYAETALRRFTYENYTSLQEQPSECLWMVPGTYIEPEVIAL